jgi:ankyrin repeat protein
MVQRLLQAGADPNAAQVTGETPIMTCARTGSAEAVKSLLVFGADANATEAERGQTALMWATAQKHPAVVGALVEHGADLNARSATLPLYTPKIIDKSVALYDFYNENVYFPKVRGGFTPLMFAAQAGDLDSVRILLAAGVAIEDATPDDGSPLVLASSNGHQEVALFLLEKGANPMATDGYGLTAMHWALQEGIIALFSRPMPTDRFWLHPQMLELVQALLDRGADPNARIQKDFLPYDIHRFGRSRGLSHPQVGLTGATPFLLAAAVADLDAMHVLVEAGADPTLATTEEITPMMVAAGMGPDRRSITRDQRKKFLEAVKLAEQWGGDVKAVGLGGRTALHGAALYGLTEVVQFLAEKGADLEAMDMYGQTAMSIALADPDGLVYRHLKDYNYDGRFRRRLGGPHEPTIELLLELGAAPYNRNGRNIKVF